MPGTLTYPIYAGVTSPSPRRRVYMRRIWTPEYHSPSHMAQVSGDWLNVVFKTRGETYSRISRC